ncbi:hypothetical protein ZWY2020_057587 [Hordeum vulgare]|nr:hypothetical protein ZWY2020_057587 [Hordeum vulgare]
MANHEPDLAARLDLQWRCHTHADTGAGHALPLYLDLAQGPQPRRRSRLTLLLSTTASASADGERPQWFPPHGWVLDKECDLLRDLLDRYPDYTLTFTGHSLSVVIRNWLQKLSELVTCVSSEFILFSATTAVRQHTCSASDF